MKKVKKFLIGNVKTVVAFIIGIVISGTSVYAATILFNSNQVGYDNTTSGMTSTNVQDALDELYTKANRNITGDGVTNVGFQTNAANTVFANSNGVCIVRKGKLSCFKTNNWSVEQTHIQQVFSDISCYVNSSLVSCTASDFYCTVRSDGAVGCYDSSDDSFCCVYAGGSIDCH